MFHTAAYYQSLNPAGVETAIPPVVDASIRVTGNDLYVPALNRLLGVAAMVSTTTTVSRGRLRAPSMLRVTRSAVGPVQGAAAAINLPGDPQAIRLWQASPPQLSTNEALDFLVTSAPAAAQIHAGVVWLADGPPTPYTQGEIFTIRATSTTAAVAGAWTNVAPLTFDDQLPVGRYSIVGFRAMSTNLLAARLVPPGYPWRPGVLGCNSVTHRDDFRFRHGHIGEFAQFDAVTLFGIEVLAGAADAAFEFHIDLVKIG